MLGEACPSRRQLAGCLGVDQDCLHRWIKKLKDVGLIDLEPGRGRLDQRPWMQLLRHPASAVTVKPDVLHRTVTDEPTFVSERPAGCKR